MLIRISYVYCTDTILDQTNQLTQAITIESLERVINERQSGRPDSKHTPLKGQSSKASPTKSDTRTSTMDKEGS